MPVSASASGNHSGSSSNRRKSEDRWNNRSGNTENARAQVAESTGGTFCRKIILIKDPPTVDNSSSNNNNNNNNSIDNNENSSGYRDYSSKKTHELYNFILTAQCPVVMLLSDVGGRDDFQFASERCLPRSVKERFEFFLHIFFNII